MNLIYLIWDFIVQWYWIPLGIINIGAFITILIENGKPEKTIAWLMVIVFVPFVGVILYYFFGQKFQKDKYFRKLDDSYSKKITHQLQYLQPNLNKDKKTDTSLDGQLKSVFSYLSRTKNAISTSNNEVTLLQNGEEKFPKLLDDLKNAKHHIHLEYYIFEEDKIGKQILNLLIEKTKEGIEVRLIIDAFGSPKLAKKQVYYEKKGLKFEVFLPVRFKSLANSNYRNHRKIAIIDGNIGYVGGINIADKYINPNDINLFWRDTSICIKGEAVKTLQLQFWLHWESISKNRFLLNKNYFPKQINTELRYNTPTTFAYSSPGNTQAYIMEAMIQSIIAAEKQILLVTPYFIPTEAFKSALSIAISKGIDVQLIIPHKGDSAIVQAATLSFLKPLINQGVQVFLYTKGFIHSKTICIDNKLSYIGTTNLDTRSFLINFEVSALVLDDKIGLELTQSFINDKITSIKFTSAYWKAQKRTYRVFASICRLLAPLL